MIHIKNSLKKDYVKSLVICFIIACLSLLPLVIKGGGFFVLTNDFDDQQIPFTIGLHNALLDGGLSGFSWDVDLGTSTLDAYSFYEAGSPFFWITMLFPANAFPYIVAWLFMLKFAFAGMTSCLYLRRFVENSKWAVLGSVLYAFSGFSLVNILFYHFHEALVFFPLLLIGLERFKEKNDYIFFIFSIFINCFVNYFFFIGEVIFLVIYYLFRFAGKDIKALVLDLIKCIACGILGVGMAAIIFLPSIIFVQGNPRTGAFPGILSMLTNDLSTYIYLIKSMLIPTDAMTQPSIIYETNFSSYGLYLPLIGLGLVIAYVINRRDRLSKIIIYLAVASFIPLLCDVFYMYAAAQMRWWYMFDLMLVLASIRMLEKPDAKAIKLGTGIYVGLIMVFIIIISIFNATGFADIEWLRNGTRFYAYAVVAIIGALITCFIAVKPVVRYNIIGTFVCIFSLGLTLTTCYI